MDLEKNIGFGRGFGYLAIAIVAYVGSTADSSVSRRRQSVSRCPAVERHRRRAWIYSGVF